MEFSHQFRVHARIVVRDIENVDFLVPYRVGEIRLEALFVFLFHDHDHIRPRHVSRADTATRIGARPRRSRLKMVVIREEFFGGWTAPLIH